MFTVLALSALVIIGIAIMEHRSATKRPRYTEQRKSKGRPYGRLGGSRKYGNGEPMATRIVRPYAIVEAYDANGNAVLPTIVYDADQLDQATERYVKLGCCTVIGTVVDVVY